MEGINGKKRFTVRFVSMNQQELSFGDHNPNSNDRANIKNGINGYVLYFYREDGSISGYLTLPSDTLVCNGYYEHERDEFVPVKDFVWK